MQILKLCKCLAALSQKGKAYLNFLLFFFFSFPLKVTDSPADVAERADRIITMLPSSPNAIEVYTGANGILK